MRSCSQGQLTCCQMAMACMYAASEETAVALRGCCREAIGGSETMYRCRK